MTRHHSMTCPCGRPIDGTTICGRCVHTLDIALANIAAYHADLELAITKRRAVRYDLPRGKGGTKSLPLVVDDRFLPDGRGTEAIHATRTVITRWVRTSLHQWPAPTTPTCTDHDCKRCTPIRKAKITRAHPRDNIGSCCAYLQRMLPRIAVATWADDCKDDLLDIERALFRVDAHGPEKVYAGLCTICLIVQQRSPLYALPGDEYVSCPAPDCGMTYRVEERRNIMVDTLEYEWMTAARIADLATYLQLIGDREWVRKKLNRWHTDGLIKAASLNDKGEPLFPFGDVSRLLMAADSRRATTSRKPA